jgi:hypothetical protein
MNLMLTNRVPDAPLQPHPPALMDAPLPTDQQAKLAAVRARYNLRPIRRLALHTNHTYLCECLDPAGRHLGWDGGPYRCQDCECEDYRETVCAQCGKPPAPQATAAPRAEAIAKQRHPDRPRTPLTAGERGVLAELLERWP